MSRRSMMQEKWDSRAAEDEVHAASGADLATDRKYVKLPPFPPEIDRPGLRCLELGCGYGRVLIPMNDAAEDMESVGVDISEVMIEKARGNVATDAEYPGAISVLQGTIDSLPFDAQSFDLVYTSATLLHLPKPMVAETVRECERVLKPDGVMYAVNSFPNRYHLWTPATTLYQTFVLDEPGRIRRYGPREVRSLFEPFGTVEISMAHRKLLPNRKSDLPVPALDVVTWINNAYDQWRGAWSNASQVDVLTGRMINVRAEP